MTDAGISNSRDQSNSFKVARGVFLPGPSFISEPLEEQRRRQRWFKGILLPEPAENDITSELDVLSVTTTMEVGVDIG